MRVNGGINFEYPGHHWIPEVIVPFNTSVFNTTVPGPSGVPGPAGVPGPLIPNSKVSPEGEALQTESPHTPSQSDESFANSTR